MKALYSILLVLALCLVGCSSEGLKSDESIGSDLTKAQGQGGEKKSSKGRVVKSDSEANAPAPK